jgi:hypothetical protein
MNTQCQCTSECQTRRCSCLKLGQACTTECRCKNCTNPFNSRDPEEKLSDCARYHIQKVVSLTPKNLNKKYALPCGCGHAILQDLLRDYLCPECDELSYYSFCLNELIEENDMWHCNSCGTCREITEWHCKTCNKCTFGLTLPCEHCGDKSPYMP